MNNFLCDENFPDLKSESVHPVADMQLTFLRITVTFTTAFKKHNQCVHVVICSDPLN